VKSKDLAVLPEILQSEWAASPVAVAPPFLEGINQRHTYAKIMSTRSFDSGSTCRYWKT
jgi:hypothetical protein